MPDIFKNIIAFDTELGDYASSDYVSLDRWKDMREKRRHLTRMAEVYFKPAGAANA